MDRIKALIVDDEKTARDGLAAIISREHPEIELAGQAGGVEEGYRQIAELNPELVFLDIMMGDGSGFDLLKKFEKINFKVIFFTAFDDYTLEAIRFSAFDYLLKPVNTRELKDALQRFNESRSGNDDLKIKMQAFISNFNEGAKSKKKIVLKTTDSIYLVPVTEIIRCEAYNNYSWVYTSNQPKLLISKTAEAF